MRWPRILDQSGLINECLRRRCSSCRMSQIARSKHRTIHERHRGSPASRHRRRPLRSIKREDDIRNHGFPHCPKSIHHERPSFCLIRRGADSTVEAEPRGVCASSLPITPARIDEASIEGWKLCYAIYSSIEGLVLMNCVFPDPRRCYAPRPRRRRSLLRYAHHSNPYPRIIHQQTQVPSTNLCS